MKTITLDHIGLLHRRFPVNLALKYFPQGAGLSCLVDTTFGENLSRISKFPYSVLQLQLLNATIYHQERRATKYDLLHQVYGKEGSIGNIKAAINKDAELKKPRLYNLIDSQLKRIDHFPKHNLVVAAMLEHNLARAGAWNICDHIKRAGFDAVDNPMQRNYEKLSNAYYEAHGNNKSGVNIVSPDGVDLSDIDFYGTKPFQNAADFLEKYWMYGDNLNFTGGKTFIPPRERTVKLTEYEFKYRLQMMREAPKPPDVRGYRLLTAPNIFKTMAEDYKRPDDARQGQPVLIHTDKVARVTLLTLEGKKIKDLPYYGTFENWGHRYYLGGTGMNHFTVYEANKKREWVLLHVGNKKYKVSIFRRTGKERP